jgi:hypothetical protein
MAGSKEVALIKAIARPCPPSLLSADTSHLGISRLVAGEAAMRAPADLAAGVL